MRHCVLSRHDERDVVDEQWRPAPAIRLPSAQGDHVAAREWLARRLRWDAQLAALHARAGIPTFHWMWECRALHWTAFDPLRDEAIEPPAPA
jgi:hypothetical protein